MNVWYIPGTLLDAGGGGWAMEGKTFMVYCSWRVYILGRSDEQYRKTEDDFRNKCYKANKAGWCDRKWWEREGSETLEETAELMDEAWKQSSHVKTRKGTFGQNLLQRVFHKDSMR